MLISLSLFGNEKDTHSTSNITNTALSMDDFTHIWSKLQARTNVFAIYNRGGEGVGTFKGFLVGGKTIESLSPMGNKRT